MRKFVFSGILIAFFCTLFIAPVMAADTPAPLVNDGGVYVSEATFVAGNMDPNLDIYLLSDAHGWRPGSDKLMTKITEDGVVFYHSSLVIPAGTKYHPAQIVGGDVIHYLEIEHAHGSWQLKPFVTDPCTYINP